MATDQYDEDVELDDVDGGDDEAVDDLDLEVLDDDDEDFEDFDEAGVDDDVDEAEEDDIDDDDGEEDDEADAAGVDDAEPTDDDDVDVDDDDEEEDEETLEVLLGPESDPGPSTPRSRKEDSGDAPPGEGEFTCRSCFLVKRRPQLADADAMICLDCA